MSRDLAAAQQALDATAASSTNQTNTSAYAAYLKAASVERTTILSKITIVDAAPMIADLEDELRQEVYWAAGKEHHTAFLDRLEGWWLRRVLRQLTDATQERVGSGELEAQMSDLREQFKQEALPIDEDLRGFTLDDATKAAHEDSTFVRQMAIIQAGKRRIAAAIRDYYRAFEQRSRWIRDDLVLDLELVQYEKRLCEEWELVFEAMRDDVGDTATEEAQEQAGRSVLAWAERTTLPIRSSVTEPFVSRGSLHMLSDEPRDEPRIGWHPGFRERLKSLLSAKEDTA